MAQNGKPILRDDKGRFLPGTSGGGRPKGAKSKLVYDFIRDFHAVWEQRGLQALEAMATEKPAEFVRAGVQLMPKDVTLSDENGSTLRTTPASTIFWALARNCTRTNMTRS
jgi:hypothetical protein